MATQSEVEGNRKFPTPYHEESHYDPGSMVGSLRYPGDGLPYDRVVTAGAMRDRTSPQLVQSEVDDDRKFPTPYHDESHYDPGSMDNGHYDPRSMENGHYDPGSMDNGHIKSYPGDRVASQDTSSPDSKVTKREYEHEFQPYSQYESGQVHIMNGEEKGLFQQLRDYEAAAARPSFDLMTVRKEANNKYRDQANGAHEDTG